MLVHNPMLTSHCLRSSGHRSMLAGLAAQESSKMACGSLHSLARCMRGQSITGWVGGCLLLASPQVGFCPEAAYPRSPLRCARPRCVRTASHIAEEGMRFIVSGPIGLCLPAEVRSTRARGRRHARVRASRRFAQPGGRRRAASRSDWALSEELRHRRLPERRQVTCRGAA